MSGPQDVPEIPLGSGPAPVNQGGLHPPGRVCSSPRGAAQALGPQSHHIRKCLCLGAASGQRLRSLPPLLPPSSSPPRPPPRRGRTRRVEPKRNRPAPTMPGAWREGEVGLGWEVRGQRACSVVLLPCCARGTRCLVWQKRPENSTPRPLAQGLGPPPLPPPPRRPCSGRRGQDAFRTVWTLAWQS